MALFSPYSCRKLSMPYSSRINRISFDRQPADTAVIRRLANQYLKNDQQSWFAATVGKAESELMYDENEYRLFNNVGIYNTPNVSAEPEVQEMKNFLNYALTIDYTLNLIRQLANQVSTLGSNYSPTLRSVLEKHIISKHYVPWRAINDGTANDPKMKKALDLRTKYTDRVLLDVSRPPVGEPGPVEAEEAQKRRAEEILLSFPIPNLMVGLAQGYFDEFDPDTFQPTPVNIGMIRENLADRIENYPRSVYWDATAEGSNGVTGMHLKPTEIALFATDPTGVDFPHPTTPLSRALSKAYKLVKANDYIAAEYIKVQTAFERILDTSSSASDLSTALNWANGNLHGGSLGQGTYKCQPGESPYFIGYQGQPVYPDEALIPVGVDASGNQMFEVNESVVDPFSSGCKAARKFEGNYSFGMPSRSGATAANKYRKKKTKTKRRYRADTLDPRYYVKGQKKLPFSTAALALKKGDPRGTYLSKRKRKRTSTTKPPARKHRVKRRKL
jgi:hypothetical protein